MANTLWDTRIGDVKVPFLVGGVGTTLVATRDPLVTDDITQGISVGAIWFNNAAGFKREWECVSNATGAAAWVFSGANYAAGGTNPSVEVTQFGSGTLTLPAEGNAFRFSSAGLNPASTGADIVLAVLSIPPNTFDGIGNRGITVGCQGSFANNGNTKTVSMIYGATTAVIGSAVTGGTAIVSTGAFSTAAVTGFLLTASVFKYGAAGSNTQIGLPQGIILGGTHSGVGAGAAGVPVALTAPENAPILVAITGNAATTATDIILNWAEINGMN